MIQLNAGAWTAEIDPQGAWLTSLTVQDHDVLFAKQELPSADGSLKVRGGCHVCVPNFGPGGSTTQPQHGYARTMPWSVESQTPAEVVLSLVAGPAPYQSLAIQLHYSLQDDGILMKLTLANNGDEPLPVCPAFHPYFATGAASEFAIDAQTYPLDTLQVVQFLDSAPRRLQIEDRTIDVSADNLPTWALWSDRLAEYVCLEPTMRGNGFVDDTAVLLGAGETVAVTCSIWVAA